MVFPQRDEVWRLMLFLFVALVANPAAAQDDEEAQPYLPGLIATYRTSDGQEVRRIVEALGSQDLCNDVRLSGATTARFQGLLWAQGAGEYRLHVFGQGPIEVHLAGKEVIRTRLSGGWYTTEPITLSFDYHPLEIHLPTSSRHADVAFFWSGPQFGIEPIAPRYLWHDRQETVESDFEHGRLLNAAFRCTACHSLRPDHPSATPASSLTRLHDNLEPGWLIDRLMQKSRPQLADDATEKVSLKSVNRQMPFYGLPRDQAEAIAAFLLQKRNEGSTKPVEPASKPAPPPQRRNQTAKAKTKAKAPEKVPPSAVEGERLFLTLGCLACHQLGDLGESGLFGGGDLTNVAAKRPADFFDRWLAEPASLNRNHRMPVFDLSTDDRTSLSLFLAEAKEVKRPVAAIEPPHELGSEPMQVARGRELVRKLQCGSCHELPEVTDKLKPVEKMVLRAQSEWQKSCAGPRNDAKSGWGYDLPPEYRHKLQAYLQVAYQINEQQYDGQQLLIKSNCLACHPREGFLSYQEILPTPLADKLAAVGQKHDELAPLIPAMTPPSLSGVGDKLTGTALSDAIRRSGSPHRPYLLVRMPKFAMEHHAEGALTAYLCSMDQLPPDAPTGKPEVEQSAALVAAGGRLVSTDGFGCVSCHQIGNVVPDKAPLNARGPSLSQIHRRIRREWFDRFIPNPSRVVPRMEMPSVQIPVKGVLGDNVDSQIAAVWQVLTTPGFEPPEPNPVRVLRTSGIAERKEPPIVVQDVVKLANPPSAFQPYTTFIHPLVIGLSNRQNFLYDFEKGRLAGWWLGDAARQRTKGKSWHWELGGPQVMLTSGKTSELALVRGDKKLVPLHLGQHAAELRGYQIRDGQVRFSYLLHLGSADDPSSPTTRVAVTEVWRNVAGDKDSGAIRELTAQWKVEEGDRLACELVPAKLAAQSVVSQDPKELQLKDGRIRLAGDDETWSLGTDGSATSEPITENEKGAKLHLTYVSLIAPDTIDVPLLSFPAEADAIEVAPGFVGRRLPLPGDVMPTALAWRTAREPASSHELVVGSLKGQVIAARDSNKDGLEDAADIVADGLATPYGVHDGGDGLHVLTKAALLEVKDGDVQVLASGWGHTDDYHDWAVGLPRNEKGEYFIGLPCQQDERVAAAAKYRGAILKLTPQTPSDDDPRRYALNVVSTGHRFPMGLALSRGGELFVTDNQGNYNPFNELNHVRPGAFFGFINANEKQDKSFHAPPLAEPAIDIPHPWTRSVNGICFLDTPQALLEYGKKDHFGPFEGQLVGCEYDTRRLIRMSLQKVGDTWQGAAYPLSVEPSSPEKGFLGPVVCAVSPRGELYVGSIRDSGWGAGNNIGEMVQVQIEPGQLPAGIAEMRAIAGGFEIDLLRAVDGAKAADIANYSLASYRRESTPAYGGPDLDRRIEKIVNVEVAPDRRRATIMLSELREGFVYELQLKNLTSDGSLFYPAEAHYTLRRKPWRAESRSQRTEVTKPPEP